MLVGAGRAPWCIFRVLCTIPPGRCGRTTGREGVGGTYGQAGAETRRVGTVGGGGLWIVLTSGVLSFCGSVRIVFAPVSPVMMMVMVVSMPVLVLVSSLMSKEVDRWMNDMDNDDD